MPTKFYTYLHKCMLACTLLLLAGSTNAQCLWTTYAPYYSSASGPLYVNPCNNAVSNDIAIKKVITTGGIVNINNDEGNTPNAIGCHGGGYSYYTGTGKLLQANAGTQVTCTLTVAWISVTTLARAQLYIDKQHDGRFDVTDTVNINPVNTFVGNGSNDKAFKFIVPTTASNGLTRMRIRIAVLTSGAPAGTSNDACNLYNDGETEDYDINIINPCKEPEVISITNVNCNSADIQWSTRANSQSYDCWVDTTGPYGIGSKPWPAGLPPVGQGNQTYQYNAQTGNTYHAGNLMENTKYYVYVRSYCDILNKSTIYWDTSKKWAVDSFTTWPCCHQPVATISGEGPNDAFATWTPSFSAQYYEYAVTSTSIPPSETGNKQTQQTQAHLSGLASAKTYYFWVRAICQPDPKSDWTLVDFKTQNSTGITNINSRGELLVDVYPNPAKTNMTVQLSGAYADNGKVEVTDVSGKLMYQTTMTAESININTATWDSGIYFVKYSDGANTRTIKVSKY